MTCPLCGSWFVELLQPCPKFFQLEGQPEPMPVEHYRCKTCKAEWVKTGVGNCHVLADTVLPKEHEEKEGNARSPTDSPA